MSNQTEPRIAAAVDPAEWVDRYGDVLYRFARSRLSDAGLAEDLVQETFLAALEAREQFAGRSSEQTWLIGILRRKIADHFRRVSRQGTTISVDAEATVWNPFDSKGVWTASPRTWPGDDPTRSTELEEFWAVFEDCVSKLPRSHADVFCLREQSELETEQICEVLGTSPTNVWTQLYRARLALRRCLEENWFHADE